MKLLISLSDSLDPKYLKKFLDEMYHRTTDSFTHGDYAHNKNADKVFAAYKDSPIAQPPAGIKYLYRIESLGFQEGEELAKAKGDIILFAPPGWQSYTYGDLEHDADALQECLNRFTEGGSPYQAVFRYQVKKFKGIDFVALAKSINLKGVLMSDLKDEKEFLSKAGAKETPDLVRLYNYRKLIFSA